MTGLRDLAREYEAQRFPPTRRLDVHAEGPQVARDRVLRWVQSFAHEQPGAELLLVVERGQRAGRAATPVRLAVEKLLAELQGRLIDWWQPFAAGSLALRVALDPDMAPAGAGPATPAGEGRTPETAGAAPLALHHDIPEELIDLARRAAELRRVREGISVGLVEVVLRRIWIESQAAAMEERIPFRRALERILAEERERVLEES